MKKNLSLAAAAILMLGWAPGASAITTVWIDVFTADHQIVSIPAGPPVQQTASSSLYDPVPPLGFPPILGNSREITLERTAGLGSASVEVSGPPTYSYGIVNTAADVSAVATFVYDGGADGLFDPSGLGGVDLTAGFEPSEMTFWITYRSNLATTLRVQIYSGSASDYLYADIPLDAGGFHGVYTSLASLLPNGSGADLSNVGAIVAIFQAPPALDMRLNVLGTVPEPSSLVLLALGALGLAWIGRPKGRVALRRSVYPRSRERNH